MNFDYSEDQLLLKTSVRKFLDARCASSVTRAVLDDPDKSYDAGLWREICEMGWTGAAFPEEYGGAGFGYVELCAIAEELGRVVAPIPFSSTVYLFAEALLQAGSDEQKQSLLPRIAAGEVIGCLATSEAPGPFSVESPAAKVENGRLSGAKLPVTDGDIASHAMVWARGAGGLGLFLVDLNGSGVLREPLATLDPTRGAARLVFDRAVCEPLPGAEPTILLSTILDRAAVLIAFEQVGGADRCLEMARSYALGRYAFGRLIGSYQAIKHKLADMYIKTELARSHAYYGAWALNTNAVELPEGAAAARVAASGAYDFASKENVQTHGGMGFTWDVDCHLHLRRSRQLALMLGGPPVWREKLVRRLERATSN